MVDPSNSAINMIKNLTIIQTMVMGVAGVLIALVLRGYYTGKWVQKTDDDRDRLTDSIREAHRRMDTAGGELSKLTGKIQAMEDKFRDIFVSRELYEHAEFIHARERADIRLDLANIREAITRIGQERRK